MFFFFKQKTAYEMRISDLSSDVCSSDLSPWNGFVMSETIMAIDQVFPVRKPLASGDTLYPRSKATLRISCLVSGLTISLSASALETVDGATPQDRKSVV